MNLNLKGKIAVVTGGSAGIGKETALEFAREGCNVAICGRTAEKLEAAKKEIEALGVKVYTEAVDITKVPALKKFADNVYNTFGSIDIWLNNAGGNRPKRMLDCTEDDFDFTVDANLKSVYFASNYAAEYMKKNGKGGVILHVSSYGAVVPGHARSLYAITKGAVMILTRCQAAELAPYNIRTAAVLPGTTKTDFTKKMIADSGETLLKSVALQKFGDPIEIAKPLVFLASDASSFITGVCLEISGGKLAVQSPEACWKAI